MAILKENWSTLTKPTSIVLKEGYNDLTKSVIVMEPFARGYGNTLGNSLRRVLLSSINGFAVTSVKIEGVMHEYAVIDGIKEDVLDIIMNLKGLAITKNDPSPSILKLSVNKPGQVYAGSIDLPAGVDIINKDHLICTLSKGAKIDMTIVVEYGRGYCSIDSDRKIDNSIGSLAIAAKILQDQLQNFINFDVSKIDVPVEKEIVIEPEFNKNLLKTIEELELSVRSYNCLKNENIIYVGDLVVKTEIEMLKTANFGRKSLNELKDNLKSMSLSFGMKLTNWPPKNIEELLKIKNKEF